MHPISTPAHVAGEVQDHLAEQTRLAERLSRALYDQARAELSSRGSEIEAVRLSKVRLEGDLGRALAMPSIEEARSEIERRADEAESAAHGVTR